MIPLVLQKYGVLDYDHLFMQHCRPMRLYLNMHTIPDMRAPEFRRGRRLEGPGTIFTIQNTVDMAIIQELDA